MSLNGHAAPERLPATHEFLLKHVLTPIFRHGGEHSQRFTWWYEAAYDHLGKGALPVMIPNGRLWINLRDQVMAKRILKWGVWEPIETALFKAAVHDEAVVVDVGANVGYYTLIAGDLNRRRGCVHAFEPHPAHFELLDRTCIENGLNHAKLSLAALSDEPGPARLYLSEGNFGDHRMFPAEEDRSSIEITRVRLDDLTMYKDHAIDVIKLDVQGAEFQVLRGAKKTLDRSGALTIFMEFWPEGLRRADEDPEQIVHLIDDHGIDRTWVIDEERGQVQRVDPEDIVVRCEGHDGMSLLATRGQMSPALTKQLEAVVA